MDDIRDKEEERSWDKELIKKIEEKCEIEEEIANMDVRSVDYEEFRFLYRNRNTLQSFINVMRNASNNFNS